MQYAGGQKTRVRVLHINDDDIERSICEFAADPVTVDGAILVGFHFDRRESGGTHLDAQELSVLRRRRNNSDG